MTEQLALFDPPAAKTARNVALKQVADHNPSWLLRAVKYVSESPDLHRQLRTFTGEQLRLTISPVVGIPEHVNAWGTLVNYLVRQKIIKPTGKWVSMSTKTSHARQTRVYYFS